MPIISEEILHDLKINTLIYLVSINTYIDRTNEIVLKGRNKLVICVISFKEMDLFTILLVISILAFPNDEITKHS